MLLASAALLLWQTGSGLALERWTAGDGGRAWDQVIDSRSSHNVEVAPEGWLQLERVQAERNLCLGVADRGGWYTGAGGSLIWSGTINGAFDANPNTAAITNNSRGRITVDLGAAFPVNRIRFYPRPSFPLRFIPGFEVYVNDGRLPPDFSGMDMWALASVTAQGSTVNVIDWDFLYERRENLESEVDLSFPRQYVRYVQVSDFETATWEFAELEVYGDGNVSDALYVSSVIDLGAAADFGQLLWDVDLDPGAGVVLRSRSGSTSDPFVYYRLTGIGPSGRTRVGDENGNGTARDEYDRLRDDQGEVVLDAGHWSFWSPPYTIQAGQEAMLSPGPRRYVQFQLELSAGDSFDDGVRVLSLSLEYAAPPLADEVVAEIAPGTVAPGETAVFRYALAGRFSGSQRGFDAIVVSTPVAIDPASVRDVAVAGVPVEAALSVGEDAFTLRLPSRVRSGDQVVTFGFECPVFVPGTLFGGMVFDSSAPEAGQQIAPGNASPDIDTDGLAVSWSLEGRLIGDVAVSPRRITPNGDGVNDAATLSFGVLQLLDAASVSVEVFDLSGRLVWETRERRASGFGSTVWEGVDQSGGRVVPGTYVYRVSVDAAAGRDERTGLIVVAY